MNEAKSYLITFTETEDGAADQLVRAAKEAEAIGLIEDLEIDDTLNEDLPEEEDAE